MISKSLGPKKITMEKLPGVKMERGIILTCAFLVTIHLAASFFPHLRLWGISQLHYFPLGFRIAISLVGLLIILVPKINRIAAEALARALIRIAEKFKKMNKYFIYSLLSLLSVVFFWVFRAKTPLLGDGWVRAGSIGIGVLTEITEPLDFYLHLLVSRMFGLDGYTAYRALSYIAGALYIFTIFLICDLLGKDRKEKLFIFSILATMGGNQLFFGYIESYSLMYVVMTAYLLFGIRYLKQKRGFVWPCLFFLLAASFHVSALIVLPSLFYLAFARSSEENNVKVERFKFVNLIGLVSVILLIGMGLYFLKTHSQETLTKSFLIYPFGDGAGFYSFFSFAHILDFLNQLFLLSPVSLVLWILFLVFFRKAINFKENVFEFLVWVIGCTFAFALFVDPKLGYARDWDLFAFAGLGVTLLGLYLFISIFGKEKAWELSRGTLILFTSSLIFTLPWLWVNASEEKAVARFEDLLRIDEKRAAYGYETLACYFRDKGEEERTVEYWKKAIAINPNPRYFGALGNAYHRLKKNDQAIEAFNRAIQMAPGVSYLQLLYNSIGICLAETRRYDEAVTQMKKAISLAPQNAEYYDNLGNTLGMAGRYEEASQCFEKSLSIDPGRIKVYRRLGLTYARLGKKNEAKKYLEIYQKSMPQDAPGMKGIIDSIEIDVEPNK